MGMKVKVMLRMGLRDDGGDSHSHSERGERYECKQVGITATMQSNARVR